MSSSSQISQFSSNMETEDITIIDEISYSPNLLNGNKFDELYYFLYNEIPNNSNYQGGINLENSSNMLKYKYDDDDEDEKLINSLVPDYFPFTKSSHINFSSRKVQTKKGIKRDIKRKEKKDDMKKKLKATFLKALKNKVNEKLKLAKSEKFFDFLPQLFVSDVTKKLNSKYLKMTMYEIWDTDFSDSNVIEITVDEGKKRINHQKYQNNHEVLEYLRNNNKIAEESEFNIIKNRTYKELYEAYIKSEEFWNSKNKMRESRRTSNEYINLFNNAAEDFIKDFQKGNDE